MNMEDRLREAFDQEAQHLHAPSGSPETAVRRGRRRRASNLIGGATLVLALVGGTAAGVQLLGDSEEPPAEDLTSLSNENAQTEQATGVGDFGLEEVEFSWNKVQLPLPANTVVWNLKVGAVDGGFVAIGRGDITSEDGPGSGMITWSSSNGRDWDLAAASEPFSGVLDDVLVTEDGFVAITRADFDSSSEVVLHQSSDGVTWTAGNPISGVAGDDQYLWLSRAASGDGVTVVAGVAQSEPGNPPILFPEFGVMLEPPTRGETFRVVDIETGELIREFPIETVYGGLGGTLTVTGPDGEVVLLLDNLADAPPPSSEDSGVEFEQDGIRLSLDYSTNRYLAVHLASGDVVAEGSIEDLYGTGQIFITHPDTGAVLLDITFDEFLEAEERSYRDFEFDTESTPVILSSRDGGDWVHSAPPLGGAEELDFSGLAYGDGGFILTVGRFGREIYSQETWMSADGLVWEMVDASDQVRRAGIAAQDGEYYGLSYGGRGDTGISRSADGIDWTPVLETDVSGYFLNEVKSGGLGLVAIGQESGVEFPVEPIIIAKEGRTFVFDTEAGSVVVTEDATGEVLLDFAFDVFSAEPPEQFQVDDETGTLTLVDEAGAVIMVITEEEGEAASSSANGEESAADYSVPAPVVLFSEDGDEWRLATRTGLDLAWSQSVAVGDDAIVIAGESVGVYAEEFGSSLSESGSVVAPATTLAFEGEYDPAVYIWVGQPR